MPRILPLLPSRYFIISGDILGCHERGCHNIQWVEAGKAAEHPAVHRTAVHNKELPGPRCYLCWGWDRGHMQVSCYCAVFLCDGIFLPSGNLHTACPLPPKAGTWTLSKLLLFAKWPSKFLFILEECPCGPVLGSGELARFLMTHDACTTRKIVF